MVSIYMPLSMSLSLCHTHTHTNDLSLVVVVIIFNSRSKPPYEYFAYDLLNISNVFVSTYIHSADRAWIMGEPA